MGASRVSRRWHEYLRTGRVIIGASFLKGVLGAVGLTLLAAYAVGQSYNVWLHGESSFATWAFGLGMAAFILLGPFVLLAPLVKSRRLELSASGVLVTARRKGRRVTELDLGWEQIEGVTVYKNTNGDSTSVHVRMILVDSARVDPETGRLRSHVDVPPGLRTSKKDLASLMERIRSTRTQHQLGKRLGHLRGEGT